MPFETIFVQCDSGERFDCPIAFISRERRWKVAEIIDRWYEGGLEAGRPRVDYYRVKTVEGRLFFLRYVSLFDAWSVWIDETTDDRAL